VIDDLEPASVAAARLFAPYNHAVLDDPRVRIVLADGRNRLRASPDSYDVVISDPSDIWVAGVGSLYTLEFYRAVRARLRPHGVMTQWVHMHSTAPADLALMVATFHAVFPHTEIWSASEGDLIFLGTVEDTSWDYERIRSCMRDIPAVGADLGSIDIGHPAAVFAGYVLGDSGIATMTRDVKVLHADDHPTLEFTTPRSLYANTTPQLEALLEHVRAEPFPHTVGFGLEHELDADGSHALGVAYAAFGQPERGIPWLVRSTTLAPDRAAFFVDAATVCSTQHRLQAAEQAFDRALELEPSNVDAWIGLGELMLARGEKRRAVECAQHALRLAPDEPRARQLAASTSTP